MSRADQTIIIQGWIERLRDGDNMARIASAQLRLWARLTRMVRKMLKGYPGWPAGSKPMMSCRRKVLRLDRALRGRRRHRHRADFFRFARRRSVANLSTSRTATRATRNSAPGHCRHSPGPSGPMARRPARASLPTPLARPGRLACWTEFHRRIESLPDEDREIFDLLSSTRGSTQAEAAAVLGVTERTVGTGNGYPPVQLQRSPRWRSSE